jgi:exonuclease VII small subunit
MTEKPVTDMSFEEALRALEEIVTRLERGRCGAGRIDHAL